MGTLSPPMVVGKTDSQRGNRKVSAVEGTHSPALRKLGINLWGTSLCIFIPQAIPSFVYYPSFSSFKTQILSSLPSLSLLDYVVLSFLWVYLMLRTHLCWSHITLTKFCKSLFLPLEISSFREKKSMFSSVFSCSP